MPSTRELEEFVAESNAIEGEPTVTGEAAFDDHLATAVFAAEYATSREQASVESVLQIHRGIMRNSWLRADWVGHYRKVEVRVGISRPPAAVDVPALMRRLVRRVTSAIAGEPTADQLWQFHLEFEWIHPFADGNGRSGRLWWMAQRLYCGYPIEVILEAEKFQYFREIYVHSEAETRADTERLGLHLVERLRESRATETSR